MKKRVATVSMVSLVVMLGSISHAASINWDNGGTGNEWTTSANWVGDVVPGGADNALFNMSGADAGYLTSGSVAPGRLYLGSNFGDTGELYISGGSLDTSYGYVGRYGVGYVHQSGGTARFTQVVHLGEDDGGTRDGEGVWNLSSGTLDAAYSGGTALDLGKENGAAVGALNITGGTLLTGEMLALRAQGTLNIQGSGASITLGGSVGASASEYRQLSGGTLAIGIDGGGVSKILVDDVNSTRSAQFDSGSILDVDFIGGDQIGSWTVLEIENAAITDLGLQFAATVDTNIWSFAVDNSGVNGILRVTAIPEPATLGFVGLAGIVVLAARRFRV